MAEIRIKRVYEAPAPDDGFRVLVDRLWPRGISKEHAALGAWWKDIAPSPELRKWFGHKAENFAAFRRVRSCPRASKRSQRISPRGRMSHCSTVQKIRN